MYNFDDKHLTRPGFEPSTSEFLVTCTSPMTNPTKPGFEPSTLTLQRGDRQMYESDLDI